MSTLSTAAISIRSTRRDFTGTVCRPCGGGWAPVRPTVIGTDAGQASLSGEAMILRVVMVSDFAAHHVPSQDGPRSRREESR